MLNIHDWIRTRTSYVYPEHTQDEESLNILLNKVGLKVNNVIDAPTFVTFVADLNIDTDLEAVMGLEKNFGIAVKDNDVRSYINEDKLYLEKKTKGQVIFDDLYKGLAVDKHRVAIGLDSKGDKVYCDLEDMPHMLVAGATGSGKSAFLNGFITSLYINHWNDTEIVAIDPKGVEFKQFSVLKNFSYIDETELAIAMFKELCEIMDERHGKFTDAKCRSIDEYNAKSIPMSHVVIVVDEFADILFAGGREAEKYLVRLVQKARACGIHLILATQCLSADVLTEAIKANISTRVCLSVKSQDDSMIILDEPGGEKLKGHGDMLFQANGEQKPIRVQGVYLNDKETLNIIYQAWLAYGGKPLVDII